MYGGNYTAKVMLQEYLYIFFRMHACEYGCA